MVNHPVHILNEKGNFSPSSFIPFCSFGDDFIGAETKEFPIPVCDIFKPKHYFDQLCYETNLEELKDSKKLRNQLKTGLTLALDYNEERQLDIKSSSKNNDNDGGNSFSMFVDTKSKPFLLTLHIRF